MFYVTCIQTSTQERNTERHVDPEFSQAGYPSGKGVSQVRHSMSESEPGATMHGMISVNVSLSLSLSLPLGVSRRLLCVLMLRGNDCEFAGSTALLQ